MLRITHSPTQYKLTTTSKYICIFQHIIVVSSLLLLASCAKAPVPPLFYPGDPQPPRLQYLTSISGEGDFSSNIIKSITGELDDLHLQRAMGISLGSNIVFVADPAKTALSITSFNLISEKVEAYQGSLAKPVDVHVDKQGFIYIADTGHNKIFILNKEFETIKTIGSKDENFRPASVYVKGNKIYSTDIKNNLIRVFDKVSGDEILTFGQDDNLGWPYDICIDGENRIIVSETGAARISIFTEDGSLITRFGQPGNTSGSFTRPKSIAVDRDGNIYVVDVVFQNVQIFNKEGTLRMYFGAATMSPDGMTMPAGIDISYDIVPFFQKYAAPGFDIEYIIAVTSQGSPALPFSKINFYGFGHMEGVDYSAYED